MRLIDADALKSAVIKDVHCIDMAGMERDADIVFAGEIENAPIVETVKRGHWYMEAESHGIYRCSVCDRISARIIECTPYCAYCGSCMVEEVNG